jgi:hypothetical protein
MGILAGLFGRRERPLPLDPAGAAADRIAACRELLESLAGSVPGRLELVPAAETVFVFIDRPPGPFGLAWFEGRREMSFTVLRREHGLSQARIQALSKKLAAAYKRYAGAPHYAARLAGRDVVVTPSEEFAAAIRAAIAEAVS